jgi:hypothetical protein
MLGESRSMIEIEIPAKMRTTSGCSKLYLNDISDLQ